MRYRYGLLEDDAYFEDAFLIESAYELLIHDTLIIEECAEDYFNNRDGWESRNWPKTFILWDDLNGRLLGKYEVDMEAIPHFYAHKLESTERKNEITHSNL